MKLILCGVFFLKISWHLKSGVVPSLRVVTVSSVVTLGLLHKGVRLLRCGLLKISCQQKAHARSSWV